MSNTYTFIFFKKVSQSFLQDASLLPFSLALFLKIVHMSSRFFSFHGIQHFTSLLHPSFNFQTYPGDQQNKMAFNLLILTFLIEHTFGYKQVCVCVCVCLCARARAHVWAYTDMCLHELTKLSFAIQLIIDMEILFSHS